MASVGTDTDAGGKEVKGGSGSVTGKKIKELEKWVQVEEEVYIAPQVTAQIFWLKNRKPDQWREKNDLTLTPSNGVLESLMELHNGKRDMES